MINSLTGLGFDTAAFVKSIYPHLHQQSISSQDRVEKLLSFVTEAFLRPSSFPHSCRVAAAERVTVVSSVSTATDRLTV